MIYVHPRPLNRNITAGTFRSPTGRQVAQSPVPALPKKSRNPATLLWPTRAMAAPVRPWLALVSLGFGAFVAILDTSMVNVTLPILQQHWQTDLPTVSWVLHLYNLLLAVCLVPAGRLADLWGRKRVTLLGLLLFLAGSVLCGLSPSLWWLLGARAVQAVGAACVSALGFALVQALFPKEHRRLALGLFGSLNAVAAATGPLVGGWLVPLFGWRAIFLVNVPFCLAGLLSVSFFVPESKERTNKAQLDGWGLVVLLLTLESLVLAIIEASSWGWTSPAVLALVEAAVLGLALFVALERQHPSPLLDLRLFGSMGFRLANLATLLYSMAVQGGLLLLSLYFLNARGASVLATAQATLPVTVTAFLFPHLLSLVGRRLSLRLRCLLGLGLMTLGLLLLWPMTMQTTWLDTLWREALFGAGIGVCLAIFPAVALAEVPAEHLGAASGTLTTFRQVGIVLGVALLIGMFSGQLPGHLHTARSDAMTLVQTDARLPGPLRQAVVTELLPSQMQTAPNARDLVQMTDDHPQWQPFKGELLVLGHQMEQLFAAETVQAYTTVWALAALFPVGGISCVVGLLLSRRRSGARPRQATTWESCYFFSRSGAITATTIAQYLAAQPPRFPPSEEEVKLPWTSASLPRLRQRAGWALA